MNKCSSATTSTDEVRLC